eukprot:2751715-Pyramimonas_sp.AAC.1
MREIEDEGPYLTIAPFPRDGLSPINNFYSEKERRRRRAKALAHVRFALHIVKHRLAHGRH